jgi:coupling of ubiquitin conjugation to ER degradation protein 1
MEDSDLAPHTTLNVPQLLVLVVLALLALRWLLSSNNSRSSSSSGSDQPTQQGHAGTRAGAGGGGGGGGVASRGAGPRANPRHVETLAQMFPQVPPRDIVWDLQRNGNNVQLTTERILSGRGLETVRLPLRFIVSASSA